MDRFADRVAELSGKTARQLQQLADVLDEVGLPGWAHVARQLALEHVQSALGCSEETDPFGFPPPGTPPGGTSPTSR